MIRKQFFVNCAQFHRMIDKMATPKDNIKMQMPTQKPLQKFVQEHQKAGLSLHLYKSKKW